MSSIIDEVLQRVNILDVVSQYVKLRKTGRNFIGLCPFHKEKTPSFSVNLEKQIFYCFGCHEGGNAINFLAKYERCTFGEALETLARQVGIEPRGRMGARRTPVFDALSKLSQHYEGNLKRNGIALRYLADRQIDDRIINDFKLGYSERRTFPKDFAKRLGVPLDMLLGTGILKMRDSGEVYDIFRGRIVIPILDVSGKVIGFGGRGLGKDVMPKYINSPESPVFTKRSVLYGLDKAKRVITDKDEAIICEGYFDLIALHGIGVANSVATLGTSITEDHVSRLRNYTENLTLMLDGDEAGVKSALRLITLFGEMSINGHIVVLPDGHDPDSFARKYGADGVARVLQEKRPLLDYFFALHARRHDLGTLEGRLAFVRLIMPYVSAMKDAVKRRLYVQRLSELTGVEEYNFWDSMGGRQIRREGPSVQDETGSAIEEKIIGILVSRPEMIELMKGTWVEAHIKDKESQELFSKLLGYFAQNASGDIKLFLNVLDREDLRRKAVSAAMAVSEYDRQEMERIIRDYLSHIEKKVIRDEAKEITERLEAAEKRGDEQALRELLEKKKHVLTAMKFKSAK
jgi:DNA primase